MRKKRALKNIFFALIVQLVTIICGFIVPKMIIVYYGSEINGLINSITQFLAYITLLQSGFGAVVKSILYKPLSENDTSELANILKVTEKFFRKLALIFLAI